MQEHVTYYNSVYRHVADRLRGAPLGDHLDEIASLVARASKATETFVLGFLEDAVAGKDSVRILDVGCGSGIHLRSALEANPQTTGIGIDMDAGVIQQARDNLARWGIDEQFQVLVADIRTLPDELDGPFNLITLFNVIYYFPVAERPTLFRALASMLAPGGAVALASSFQGKDVWAANLDLATRSTLGCAPLPELHEITQQFQESGFRQIKQVRLMPGTPFHGILATRTR
jgi:cyclopropane fatty-acyl-phospholipid synthase-like methyltransferase